MSMIQYCADDSTDLAARLETSITLANTPVQGRPTKAAVNSSIELFIAKPRSAVDGWDRRRHSCFKACCGPQSSLNAQFLLSWSLLDHYRGPSTSSWFNPIFRRLNPIICTCYSTVPSITIESSTSVPPSESCWNYGYSAIPQLRSRRCCRRFQPNHLILEGLDGYSNLPWS